MAKSILRPEQNAILQESIEKEIELRVKWNYRNKNVINKAAQLTREFKNNTREDIAKIVTVIQMPIVTNQYTSTVTNRRQGSTSYQKNVQGIDHLKLGHSIVDVGLGDPKDDPKLARPNTDLTPDPIMRPVEPKVKKLLFKTKPNLAEYLAERNKLSNEEKYYFAECSSWDYGWRLRDSKLDMRAGCYGRKAEMQKIFNGKVGPAPDPAYYGKPDTHDAFCFRLLR